MLLRVLSWGRGMCVVEGFELGAGYVLLCC